MKQKIPNTAEFITLLEMEKSRKITIGTKTDQINNFWSNTTLLGKIFNWFTYFIIISVPVVWIKFGFLYGILCFVFLLIYIRAINKIAGIHVRLMIFANEELFNDAYEAGSITIRDNQNRSVLKFPDDWRHQLKKL